MTPEQFDNYAQQGYNRIPIARQVLADLDTPLSAYLKLADATYTYLFESVHGGEKWGRYSIIGLPCRTVIKVRGQTVTIEQGGRDQESQTVENPLQWIEAFSAQFKTPEIIGFPRFTGGLVGYFGYETMAYIEPRLKTHKPDPIGNPDIVLMVSEDVLVFDNLSGKLLIVTHANPAEADAYAKAEAKLDNLVVTLRNKTLRPREEQKPTHVDEADFFDAEIVPPHFPVFAVPRSEIEVGSAAFHAVKNDIIMFPILGLIDVNGLETQRVRPIGLENLHLGIGWRQVLRLEPE